VFPGSTEAPTRKLRSGSGPRAPAVVSARKVASPARARRRKLAVREVSSTSPRRRTTEVELPRPSSPDAFGSALSARARRDARVGVQVAELRHQATRPRSPSRMQRRRAFSSSRSGTTPFSSASRHQTEGRSTTRRALGRQHAVAASRPAPATIGNSYRAADPDREEYRRRSPAARGEVAVFKWGLRLRLYSTSRDGSPPSSSTTRRTRPRRGAGRRFQDQCGRCGWFATALAARRERRPDTAALPSSPTTLRQRRAGGIS
jgi:hypothetical protein